MRRGSAYRGGACKTNVRQHLGLLVDTPDRRRHVARLPAPGEVAEWLKAADCKSARASVRWFESSPLHQLKIGRANSES